MVRRNKTNLAAPYCDLTRRRAIVRPRTGESGFVYKRVILPPPKAQSTRKRSGKRTVRAMNSGERRPRKAERPPMGQRGRHQAFRRGNLSGIKDRGVNSIGVRPFLFLELT